MRISLAILPATGELPRDLMLWPEVLGRAGYRTLGIGKWRNDRPSFNRAFSDGGPISQRLAGLRAPLANWQRELDDPLANAALGPLQPSTAGATP